MFHVLFCAIDRFDSAGIFRQSAESHLSSFLCSFFSPKVFFQSKAFCWSIGIFFIDDMSYDLRLKLYLFVFPSFVCAPFLKDHHQKLLAPSQPSVRSTTRSFKFQVDFSPSRFLFAFFSLVEFSTTNAFLRVYGLSEDERKRERNKTKP